MSESSLGCVYVISGNLRCRAVYVGQTSNPKKRWVDHKTKLRAGTSGSTKLQRAFSKYGEAEFHFIVVERPPIEKLTEREQAWLDGLRLAGVRLLNCGECAHPQRRGVKHTDESRHKCGEANRGRRLSAEHRRKLSEVRKGRRPSAESIKKSADSRRGYRHTAEAIRKMSESSTGKTHTAETLKKMSAAATGRIFTDEHRRKIGDARRGRRHTDASRLKMRESIKARAVRLTHEMLTGTTT